MAKRERKKTGGVKNPDRRNGKAWGRHSRNHSGYDDQGHNATGRSKPSGNSVCGISVKRIVAEMGI